MLNEHSEMTININNKVSSNGGDICNIIIVNISKSDIKHLQEVESISDLLNIQIDNCQNLQDKKRLTTALEIILRNANNEIDLKFSHINPNETIKPVTDINKKDNN